MRPRYSFSSRHTGQARDPKNIKKQKGKFPEIARNVLEESDIIIQVLDARFIEETRNTELENKIKKKKKMLINVANKSDLVNNPSRIPEGIVKVSSSTRNGISKLRDIIKILASKTKKEKVIVGILGYPNTGKSSLINTLIGKNSARTASEAGHTKNIQKLKLMKGIMLMDTPGVIPKAEYSETENKKVTAHAKVGARTYTRVRDPESIITDLMKQYPGLIEKHYKIDSEGNSEVFIEKLGRQKNILKKGNEVDFDKVSRRILRDWQEGKITII